MQPWPCCKVNPVGGGRMLARPVCCAAGLGTTTRGTAVLRTVTTTSPTTRTTTLAFVAPELTTKPDGLNLNRPPSPASASRRQNPKAPGVLVAKGGCPANARRRAAPGFVMRSRSTVIPAGMPESSVHGWQPPAPSFRQGCRTNRQDSRFARLRRPKGEGQGCPECIQRPDGKLASLHGMMVFP